MMLDPDNHVIALCTAGVALEGTPREALALFDQAWVARTDDYEACIAAHFVARHQATPEETLRWNMLALRHAEAVANGRAAEFMASLYLNLADAHAAVENKAAATAAIACARNHLAALPSDGYGAFVAVGIERLARRLAGESRAPAPVDH